MTMPATTTTAHCEAVLDEIGRVVVGKRSALALILTTVLAGGHVLIEDLPGMGKTLIARSFAAALGLRFTRVQFTPDLLPADLLGSTVYDMQSGRFEFRSIAVLDNRHSTHHRGPGKLQLRYRPDRLPQSVAVRLVRAGLFAQPDGAHLQQARRERTVRLGMRFR